MPTEIQDSRPDNPLAFPREDYQAGQAPGQCGMLLRDYFAAAALAHQNIQFVIEAYKKGNRGYDRIEYPPMEWSADERRKVSEWSARDAYATADAMLAERAK